MRIILKTAALVATAFAAQASAEPGDWTSDAAIMRLAGEAYRACPVGALGGLPIQAEALAGLHPLRRCRERPALALGIAEALANRGGAEAADGHRLLAEFRARGIGAARDEEAAREHRRRAWMLRPSVAGARPFADRAETDAWLARDASIAFLRRYAALPGMPYLRMRLARALVARNRAGDAAEARLIADDPIAVGAVRRLVWTGLDHQAAQDDLAFLAARRLAEARQPAQRQEAIALLADAAFAPDSPHRDAFLTAVAAANGGVRPPPVAPEQPAALRKSLRLTLGPDDYPASAIRANEQGRVVLRALADPAGRLIFTEPATENQPPRLVAGLRRLYAQRPPAPLDLGALRTAPYMWIELPGYSFNLPE